MLNKIGTKSLLALAIVLGATIVGVGTVSADTTDTKQNFMTTFATSLSQKFGLNETEVKTFLETEMQKHRTEMQAQFAQNFEDRLAKGVTDGKITQAQADLIKAKQTEIKTQLEALKPAVGVKPTDADREKMKTIMDGLKTWADSNNIPKEFIMLGGHKGGRGFGKMGHF